MKRTVFVLLFVLSMCWGISAVFAQTANDKQYFQTRKIFLKRFFEEQPTPTRKAIKENLKKLIRKDLVTLRYAHQHMPGITSSMQRMLDQINTLTPQTEDSTLLENFKSSHIARLQEPLDFLQSRLDKNPALCAYTFRPSLDVLHTRAYFKTSRPGKPFRAARVRIILNDLFSIPNPQDAPLYWTDDPAVFLLEEREAILWFAPARYGEQGLLIKVNFSTRMIFVDLSNKPS